MSQINLLPWREQARQAKKKEFGLQSLGVLLVAFFCIIILNIYFNSVLRSQKSRNDYLQAELNTEQTDLGNLDKNVKQQQEIDAQLQVIMALRERNYDIIHLLDELVRVVPESVFLSKITYKNKDIIIAGKSKSNLEITLFMNKISRSSVFKQPDLTEITGKENSDGEDRSFILKVTQND